MEYKSPFAVDLSEKQKSAITQRSDSGQLDARKSLPVGGPRADLDPEFAGAAEQLTDALIVNPYNTEQMADAIKRALVMEKSERIERYNRLMTVIRGYDCAAWSASFLATLEAAAKERSHAVAPLTPSMRASMAKLARTPLASVGLALSQNAQKSEGKRRAGTVK